ncbi:MAG: hypothetical protein GXP42_12310 [Chloroflexi bacterium]|nr:hypothetical protein [Chloroflexota bacterium]
MTDAQLLGRVLRSATGVFTFGCTQNEENIPQFGQPVRAAGADGDVYGLVYEIIIQDDPFVRQIVAASDSLTPERIEDMRQRRQVPVEVSALAVAYRRGELVRQGVPPRPPAALRRVFACNRGEVDEVLGRGGFQFMRIALNHAQCPAEDLLVASLGWVAQCRPPGQEQPYLVEAGRELTRLLAHDPLRLDAILRGLADLTAEAQAASRGW